MNWLLIVVALIALILFAYKAGERLVDYLVSGKDRRLETFWLMGISDLLINGRKENREYLLDFIRSSISDFRDQIDTMELEEEEDSNTSITETFRKIVYSKDFDPPFEYKSFRAEYCKLVELSFKKYTRLRPDASSHRWFTLALLCSIEEYIKKKLK